MCLTTEGRNLVKIKTAAGKGSWKRDRFLKKVRRDLFANSITFTTSHRVHSVTGTEKSRDKANPHFLYRAHNLPGKTAALQRAVRLARCPRQQDSAGGVQRGNVAGGEATPHRYHEKENTIVSLARLAQIQLAKDVEGVGNPATRCS